MRLEDRSKYERLYDLLGAFYLWYAHQNGDIVKVTPTRIEIKYRLPIRLLANSYPQGPYGKEIEIEIDPDRCFFDEEAAASFLKEERVEGED